MNQRITFMSHLITGSIGADPETAVLDWIDKWHAAAGDGTPLHTWLGMSWQEFSHWVEHPGSLHVIVAERRAFVNAMLEAIPIVMNGGLIDAVREGLIRGMLGRCGEETSKVLAAADGENKDFDPRYAGYLVGLNSRR